MWNGNFLPTSNNDAYRGSVFSPALLCVLGLMSLISGSIHAFLPDAGLGVIGGLDLSQGGERIIGTAAWAGATQMVWGSAILMVVLCYRAFTRAILALILLERSIMLLNWFVLKPADYHPPEVYVTCILWFLVVAGIWLAHPPARD